MKKQSATRGSRSSKTPKLKKNISELLGTQARIKEIRQQKASNPQYRSSFTRIFNFNKGLVLSDEQLSELRQTPFGEFYIPILQNKITPSSVKKSDHLIHRILATYNPEKKAFIIGNKRLTIKTTECQLLFGLTNGGTKMLLADGTRSNKPQTDFYLRNFSDCDRVTHKELKTALLRLQHLHTPEAIADITRILVLSVMVNFFFTTNEVVNWSFFQYVDDLKKVNDCNWAEEVVKFFMKSVHKVVSRKADGQSVVEVVDAVQGCASIVLYWFLERCSLFKEDTTNKFPRFRKWDLQLVCQQANVLSLKHVLPDQISHIPLRPKRYEVQLLGHFQDEEHDVDDNKVGVEEEESTTQSERQMTSLLRTRAKGKGKLVDEIKCITFYNDETEKEKAERSEPKIEELVFENSILNKKILEMQNNIAQLEVENANLIGQVSTLKCDVDERLPKEEEAFLQAKIKSLENMNKLQEEELAKFIDLPTNSQIEASHSTKLEQRLQELQIKFDAAFKKNVLLETDVATLRAANETVIKEKEDLVHKTAETIQKNVLLETDVATLRAANETLIKEKEDLVHKTVETNLDIDKSQGSSDASFNSIQELHCQVVELEKENERMKKEIERMEEEKNKLKEKLEEMENTLKDALDAKEQTDCQVVDEPIKECAPKMTPKSTGVHKRTRSRLNESLKNDDFEESKPAKKAPPVDKKQGAIAKKRRKDLSYKKHDIYKLLSEADQIVVDNMAESIAIEDHRGKIQVWNNPNGSISEFVDMIDIIGLLKQSPTSNNVLDSYMALLLQQQEQGEISEKIVEDLEGESFGFPSSLLGYYRQHNGPQVFEQVVKNVIEKADILQYRYMLFPLHSSDSSKATLDHWTLVVLDRLTKKWTYYNSLKPRNVHANSRIDPYIRDAEQMIQAVDAVVRKYAIQCIPLDAVLEEFEDSPQQKPGSQDCGIFVLHIIKQYFHQQHVDKLDAEVNIDNMRKELVHDFLNHNHTVQHRIKRTKKM